MRETAYDVSVELTLPRSPPNVNRGNFMVSLFATKSDIENPAQSWTLPSDPYAHVDVANVVFSSRRPALVPYSDPFVSYASRALFLLWHIFVPASEQVKLDIPMGELVEFKNELPLSILLDVQAGQTFQVYSAKIELVARLTGVRWAMYNHRILSFVFCTTFFWFAEMLSMGLAWLLLAHFFGERPKKDTVPVAIEAGKNGAADEDYKNREIEWRGGARGDDTTFAGSTAVSGVDSVASSVAKYEEEDERKIKEESVERGMPSDSSRRVGYVDGEDGEGSTGAHYDKRIGATRRRSSQMEMS
jgi:seipin